MDAEIARKVGITDSTNADKKVGREGGQVTMRQSQTTGKERQMPGRSQQVAARGEVWWAGGGAVLHRSSSGMGIALA